MNSAAQVIYTGAGCCEKIGGLLAGRGVNCCLLVCGKSFQRSAVMAQLRALPVSFVVFDAFSVNPRYEEVCAGVDCFRAAGCTAILVCGGGSALDVAKCIRLFAEMPAGSDYLTQPMPESAVPLLAVPTTAGTGSESTRFAVIYRGGEKQSVHAELALPEVVLLDPTLLATLPRYQKICTMLDALCQAIESWWSVHSTAESRALAAQAVPQLMAAMDGYLANEPSGNAAMLTAANLAGQAINPTATTAPHAMSYRLTTMYGLPHGRSCAVSLVRVWAQMLRCPDDCRDARGKAFLAEQMQQIAQALGCRTPKDAVLRLMTLLEQLGLAEPLPHAAGDAALLAQSVNQERLGNHPTLLSPVVLEQLYTEILENAPILL